MIRHTASQWKEFFVYIYNEVCLTIWNGSGGYGGEGEALLFCQSKKRANKQIGKPWTDLVVKRRAGGGELAAGGFLVLFCGRKKNKTLFLLRTTKKKIHYQ